MCDVPTIDMAKTGQNIVNFRKQKKAERIICKSFTDDIWV